MKFITLFINGQLGLELIDVIQSQEIDCQLKLVVINGEEKYSRTYHDKVKNHPAITSNQIPILVFSKGIFNSDIFKSAISSSTLGVSALFGHLFPKFFISDSKIKLINLHPSLLPLGRGSDPIAWGIMESRQQGATIHEITEKLDSGRIISQQEVRTDLSLNAGEIYTLAVNSLKHQFIEYLHKDEKVLESVPQVAPHSYHNSEELETLRKSLLINGQRLEESIRIIQALTFNDGRAAMIKASDGNVWEVKVQLKRILSEK